jgi:hypothetical protein
MKNWGRMDYTAIITSHLSFEIKDSFVEEEET